MGDPHIVCLCLDAQDVLFELLVIMYASHLLEEGSRVVFELVQAWIEGHDNKIAGR